MIKGTLLAESLRVGADLRIADLRLTRVGRHDVSASVSASQPSVWTFIEFEADESIADTLAQALARCLLVEGGWYADFTVGDEHVVAYANKIFRYHRGDSDGRAEAVAYGRLMGVPEHQLDWPD
jgi:hypothetical protein